MFLQNQKQLLDLFFKINSDSSNSKSTFYPFAKILPKTTSRKDIDITKLRSSENKKNLTIDCRKLKLT